ncbi:sulfotransferase [Alcanivorax sp. S6407]|uniref:sulfotransferase domain-containing protein n=1 Tax=Alcanivorax sp. S6407 TaxID=2926424 RepID=UPI001FF147EE|nr:sulfotransferase domain-containing protein [Alcanivorax sp. S6407]MCK0152841.1 sulfotransferase [Alcanivorax sp. S6407]
MNKKEDLKSTKTPDFLIVGAAKSGTSSLHAYLSKHPDIYMPEKQKELYFWHAKTNPNRSIVEHRGVARVPVILEDYLSYFSDAEDGQITGEACPSYLYYCDHVLDNLKSHHADWKNIKIVIILREPVSRILSQYRFVCKHRLDPDHLDFCASLEAEKSRLNDNKVLPDLFYVDVSMYVKQVDFYINNFNNVYVCLYDDLKENPRKLIADLCGFVGVDAEKLPISDFEIVNGSSGAKRLKYPAIDFLVQKKIKPMLQFLPDKVKKILRMNFEKIVSEPVNISSNSVLELKTKFQSEVSDLENLIKRDLSEWKFDKTD